jgi:hypothetical protein
MNKKLYAFWKYDRFPFCLGGEVTDMRADGSVETVGYGPGFYFKPFLLLPLKEGKEKARELENLKNVYNESKKQLTKVFTDKAEKIIQIPR